MKVFILAALLSIRAESAVVLAAPSPAPSSAPAPGVEAMHINFEIKNINYYDLTKETCPKKVVTKVHKSKDKPSEVGKTSKSKEPHVDPLGDAVKGADDAIGDAVKGLENAKAPDLTDDIPAPNVTEAVNEIHGHARDIEKQLEKGSERESSGLPWMKGKKEKSFLQVGACMARKDLDEAKSKKCTTVMDVLRNAIKETVQGIIECLGQQGIAPVPAPGPAPASVGLPAGLLPASPAPAARLEPLPPSASFLQARVLSSAPAPAPGPAPGPGPSPGPAAAPLPVPKIFVFFSPGKAIGSGRSTMVEIAFLDRPKNGIDDVAMATPLLHTAVTTGVLHKEIAKALHIVTGIKPKLSQPTMKSKVIEQWPVKKCEGHMKDIVGQFSLHYTRNQVPMALYNECTNFMTRMSFSHDYVLDPMDTKRCRQATAKFAKRWKSGENAENKDFEVMCVRACEAKYGRNAPTCNIETGDELSEQPLF